MELRRRWKRRIETSQDVHQSKENLQFHRRKMRKLLEELSQAEILEKELVIRHKTLEESMKPALLKLQEQLNNNKDVVDDEVVEACIKEEKPDEIVEMLRRKAISMNKMNRTRLLGFMKTVLRFREQPD